MIIDQKMAGLLSDFFLDMAKAIFITTFIAPPLQKVENPFEIMLTFGKGILTVVIFLTISRRFLQIRSKK